jgi:hypothetical protein
MTAAIASGNITGSIGSKFLMEPQYQLIEICDRLGRLQHHLGDLRMDVREMLGDQQLSARKIPL